MVSVNIRTRVTLIPGAVLRYGPTRFGGHISAALSDRIGKVAWFERHGETLVGALDTKGRMPGRYAEPLRVRVLFKGETEVCELDTRDFEVDSCRCVMPAPLTREDAHERLGNLPRALEYYPDDIVHYKGVECRVTSEVITDEVDGPRQVQLWETDSSYKQRQSEKSTLARVSGTATVAEFGHLVRGNVFWLYADPSKLSFGSYKAQIKFWARAGVSETVLSSFADIAIETRDAVAEFKSGRADLLYYNEDRHNSSFGWHACRLHKCWAEHRQRVRELTERLYPSALRASVA